MDTYVPLNNSIKISFSHLNTHINKYIVIVIDYNFIFNINVNRKGYF